MPRSLFVAEPDADTRTVLSAFFSAEGYHVRGFENAVSLLSATRDYAPSCLLLDVALQGLDVLSKLKRVKHPSPILMTSCEADVATAVQAIKFGAFDFIEKPFELGKLLQRVALAVSAHEQARHDDVEQSGRDFSGGEKLTARERDVLRQITGGASNKEAGRSLGISPRTIEVHRARIMQKLNAKNAADLVRIVIGQAQSF